MGSEKFLETCNGLEGPVGLLTALVYRTPLISQAASTDDSGKGGPVRARKVARIQESVSKATYHLNYAYAGGQWRRV